MSEENWMKIARGFLERANFPNCIGAIDGKHIRIIKPKDSGSLYYNYKSYFSIVLLAVCDTDYMFIFVDIGSYGRHSDSTIFQDSAFYQGLRENTLNIPPPAQITDHGKLLPHIFVADEAFSLSENVLRPYGGKNLTVKKRIFNYRLSRARRFIECSFGILANKWRIFHRPLDVSVDFAIDIVKACCILHNFVRARDGYKFTDTLSVAGLEDIISRNVSQQGGRLLNSIRDNFADYFLSDEGKLEWQCDCI
jgi:hypothetical protein